MPKAALKLHPDDNVLIALRDLRKGEEVELDGHSFSLTSDVPAKHKFAAAEMASGRSVFMYGVLVGKATQTIPQGIGPECSEHSPRCPAVSGEIRGVSLDSAGCFALARADISRVSASGRAGRHAQLLAGGAAGVLREPQH